MAHKFSNLQSLLIGYYPMYSTPDNKVTELPKSLTTLKLKFTNTSDFSFLLSLTALKSLTLFERYVTDKTLIDIADHCLELEFLQLSTCMFLYKNNFCFLFSTLTALKIRSPYYFANMLQLNL